MSFCQVVLYSLLFVMMVVNGQDTRGAARDEPQETLASTLQEVRNMFENMHERFDRVEERFLGMENHLKELKTKQNTFELNINAVIRSVNSVQGNVTNLSQTSQSNHVDQLNKMDEVATVVKSNNEEIAQSWFNNVTRQLRVFTEDILSNTRQRGCDQPEDITNVLPRDCADLRARGHTTSGVYKVYLGERKRPLAVYCDMTTGSVGWTVFQRRKNGTLNFYLNWTDYQTGFGNIRGEFWIGNDNLHFITSSKRYKLRVELTAFDNSTAYAEFDNFTVASATDQYRLTSIGRHSGTAGNSMSDNVGEKFSTKDNDNDLSSTRNKAVDWKGAWWYNSNYYTANLNGKYCQTERISEDGVWWFHLRNNQVSLKRTEMKLTPFI